MFPQSKQILVVLAFLLHNGLLFSQGTMDCPSPTFFKAFGNEFQTEYGNAIVRTPDNFLYIAGRNGNRTFIQKLTSSGQVVWTRDFQVSAFEVVTPSEIILDSEGMIVGCGTQGQAGLSKGFVFRFNPTTGAMLWAHQISSNNPTTGGIVEAGPGGNFILCQNSLLGSGERDAELIEINRTTGLLNPSLAKRYEYISSDVFSKLIYTNGAMYVTGTSAGRYGFPASVPSRQLLARIDPGTFDPIWVHLNPIDTLAQLSFTGRDLLVDGDALISAFGGTIGASFGASGADSLYLQKTDLNGNIAWVRSYAVPAGLLKLLSVPDGYILYAQKNGNEHIVFKTNKDGVPLWGKRLTEATQGSVFAHNFAPNQAVTLADSLYFTGVSTHGNFDVFLWKMLGDGTMADSCGLVDTFPVLSTLLPNPFRTLVEMKLVFSTAGSVAANPSVPETELTLQQFCPDCTIPDPCPEDNDFVVAINDIYCEQGKINMQFTFCDTDGGAVPPLTVNFYAANPFVQEADLLGTYEYSPVTNDSCWSAELTDLAVKFGANGVQNGATIYAVVNVPANAITPFNLNDFPLTDLAECNYENNLTSYQIHLPDAPELNLGADRHVCPNQGAILDAGAGFYKYQWSNGQTTQSITVNFSGEFRVTATDFCGFKFTDTVAVEVLPSPQVSESGSFCPGRSVTIRGEVFDEPGIFQKMLPGANGQCDTIATFFITELSYQTRNQFIRFCPGESVTVNGTTYSESGLAKDTLAGTIGCDTIVFYFIQQLPLPFRLDTAYICPGDSVKIGDRYYHDAGLVTDTLPNMGPVGCDTLLRVRIILLPQVVLNEQVSFCQGTSVEIQGQEYSQPGILEFRLPSTTGGCDTLLRYTLEWSPGPTRSETVRFCPGTSVALGGNTYTDPGIVTLTLAGLPGTCDTVVTYTLEWLPAPAREETIRFCPGRSVEIDGQSYTQPGTVAVTIPGQSGACDTLVTYTLEWLPGPTRSETLQFCPGRSVVIDGQSYTQPGTVTATVPGQSGACDTVITYTLEWLPAPTREENVAFCRGSSVQLGGNTYTQPGDVMLTVAGSGSACDTVVTYHLSWLPYQTASEAVVFCPGQSVQIGGQSYSQPGIVVDTIPAGNGGCDVIVTYTLSFRDLPTRSETVEFCKGSSVSLGGQNYSQPATVVLTLPGANGACDTVVTYHLQYEDPLPSILTANCPFNVNVATTPGTGAITVQYAAPTAVTDCTCPGIEWTLTSGLPSGSLFQPGKTTICYTAKDSCGSRDNCCFDVIVREEGACDSKTIGCMKYDILQVTADDEKRYTYRIRVTNMCSNKLIYTAIQLPDGILAVSPANNAVYESPEGIDYLVRNPNYAPFYSIRFKTVADSISNGQSTTLKFTLPAQVHPNYFRIISRLAQQQFYEAHLNTFNCPVGVTMNRSGEAAGPEKRLLAYPNPNDGRLFVDLTDWEGLPLQLRVLDSRGSLVQELSLLAEAAPYALQLQDRITNGLYFLEVITTDGQRESIRIVVEK